MGVRRKDKNEEDLVSAGGGCLLKGKGLKGDRYMKFYCPLGVHVDMYRTGNILFLSAGEGRGGSTVNGCFTVNWEEAYSLNWKL